MEQIKNSKGKVLPQPYLDLARMRREQQDNKEWVRKWMAAFSDTNSLNYAFDWDITAEKEGFWGDVYSKLTPEIPAASLAELDDWRKANGLTSNFDGLMEAIRTIPIVERLKIAMEVREQFGERQDTADWKAMYYELLDKLESMAAEGRKRGYLPKNEKA